MKKLLKILWKVCKWYAILDISIWAYIGVGHLSKRLYDDIKSGKKPNRNWKSIEEYNVDMVEEATRNLKRLFRIK